MCTLNAYAPAIPSPLNPSILPPISRSAVDDNNNGKDIRSTLRPLAPIMNRSRQRRPSPSEKLLRKKAAEAWKSEALHRQVMQYERQALDAITAKKSGNTTTTTTTKAVTRGRKATRAKVSVKTTATTTKTKTHTDDADWSDSESEDGAMQQQQQQQQQEEITSEKVAQWGQLFQLPSLGFFAPKKLAKSLKIMRVFVSWRVRRRQKPSRKLVSPV